ncbi:hypothetical protein D3C81_08290 [compost metagenome]
MDKISINDLMLGRKKIKSIVTGSELLFIYELNKYTKKMLGKELDLEGLQVSKNLLASEELAFVLRQGLSLGIDLTNITLTDYSKHEKLFFTSTIEGLLFEKDTDEEVVFNLYCDYAVNNQFNRDFLRGVYVSTLAFLIVRAKLKGTSIPKLVIKNIKSLINDDCVHMEILRGYGNKFAKDILEIQYYSENDEKHSVWVSYVTCNRQRGVMNRKYSSAEKFRLLKKNFEVGDVVLFYRTKKYNEGKTIADLCSCYPAVIEAYTSNSIVLSYYPTVETKLTQVTELSMLEDDLGLDDDDSCFGVNDYTKFIECKESCSLLEIGIDVYTFTDELFILKPFDSDGTYQYFRTPEGGERVWLSTLDTIFAVFEDRNVSYNREKFLQTYFYSKNRVPKYLEYSKAWEKLK